MILEMINTHFREERPDSRGGCLIDPRCKVGNSFETRPVLSRADLSLKGRAGTPVRFLGIVGALQTRLAGRVIARGVSTP